MEDYAAPGSTGPCAGLPETTPVEEREVLIEPESGWLDLDLRELWEFRGLFLFFVWRDIKIRYAQTLLGAAWALLQPLLTMAIFTVIFGRVANLSFGNVSYALGSLVALIPWYYFSTALSGASNSLVGNANLLTKIYFPRLVIPLAPILAGFLDLGISALLLVAAFLYYGVLPAPASLVFVPAALFVIALTAAGAGCWFAALNARFRDIKYIVPFLLQVWMYASPIVYPSSLVKEGYPQYYLLYFLNPLAGAIMAIRGSPFGGLGGFEVDAAAMGISAAVSVLLFVTGVVYFRHMERSLADVV